MNAIKAPQKRTSPWPYAIVATFVLFAGYIGFMVKQAMSSSVELVSTDYYQKELDYQQHINTMSRTASLAEAVAISHDNDTRQLSIQLPQELAGQQVEGSVHFFRPSDLHLDFEVPLQPDANLLQQLSTQKLKPGFWRLRLNFTVNGQPYYAEQGITIAN